MGEKNSHGSMPGGSLLNALFVALGTVLIIASWTPIGRNAAQATWTNEDSAAYSRLRQQHHRTAYQSPERAGISTAEQEARQEKLKIQTEAMRKKLQYARQQPQRWSRYLLWAGALLAAIGGLRQLTTRA